MKSIAPFLMFVGEQHGKAEEALRFYVSQFPGAKLEQIEYWGAGDLEPAGTVKLARILLGGRPVLAMDSAAPHRFAFNPAISLFVECESVAEIDRLYAALAPGGAVLMELAAYPFAQRFAWVADRYGVNWQLRLQ